MSIYSELILDHYQNQGIGCAISKASSSMLTEYLKGKAKDELQKLDKDFMIKMLGIDLGINRIKCALLPLEALKKLLVINKNG
ncbi:MAG: Nitrogen fixation protein NifU [Candidatus Roizmanbacteria bacterium GW2011_GWA2_35_8]|uniref:Nitrogen fixation protein NifU n=1 Tax=Candidatus Roizmanbacteria bacterium GW2011_GWA2_35_8 TaxID=1618479 RepID=A0A0G0G1Y1_9BACT|nr:MAG: Nitrogen fixation protein NifU [Candidatus Roizmanbacteria bacterium GW2011_GWA2_35_8]